MRHPFRLALLASTLLTAPWLLAGCAVGPDFERPPAPNVKSYESTPLPAKTEEAPAEVENGKAQVFVVGQEVPDGWWSFFHSGALDVLVKKALAKNPDIEAAEASLRMAHEDMLAGYGQLLPAVDLNAGATREKISGLAFGSNAAFPPFTVYNATVDVSYGIDLFGGARRDLEAREAREDYQKYELEAARITIASNVVTAAVTEASLRGQIEATKQIIDAERESLDLTQKQFDLGAVAETPVLALSAQLAQAQATLPPLEKQLAQVRHELSALAGDFPSEEPDGKFELASLTLPDEVPVSLPSKLVDQRPDIKAAEASLHAASAEIGVATAAMLPQITLSADIGAEAGNIGKFFTPGTGIWELAAGVSQPVFHGGTLWHEKNEAEAAYDQAFAQYKKTVIAAFVDVADVLRALQADAETLQAQATAEKAARDSFTLAKEQYDAGATSYLALLSAEQAEEQAKLGLVTAEANRFADTAALFQALGGGWWNRPDADHAAPAETKADANNGANKNNDGLQAPVPQASPASPVEVED